MLESLHVQKLERFVVFMCSNGCVLAKVIEAIHRILYEWKKYSGEQPTLKQLFLMM